MVYKLKTKFYPDMHDTWTKDIEQVFCFFKGSWMMNWQPATAFVGDKGHPLLGGGFCYTPS